MNPLRFIFRALRIGVFRFCGKRSHDITYDPNTSVANINWLNSIILENSDYDNGLTYQTELMDKML